MYSKRKISKTTPIITDFCYWKRYTICATEDVKLEELVKKSEKITTDFDFFIDVKPLHKIGFLIIHAGLDMDFVLFGFWVNSNELMLKVFKSLPGESDNLQSVDLNNSSLACVWDLTIITHEQKLWVDTILKPEVPDIELYRNDQLECFI